MGENVLQGQVKAFKKGADRTLAAMALPTLFDRPDILSLTYTAKPIEGRSVSVGDVLDAHLSGDGSFIILAKGHVSIAHIEGDGSKSLVGTLSQPDVSGIVRMQITHVSHVSGFIKAVMTNEEGSVDS